MLLLKGSILRIACTVENNFKTISYFFSSFNGLLDYFTKKKIHLEQWGHKYNGYWSWPSTGDLYRTRDGCPKI